MSFNDYIYWQTLQETGKTPEEIYEYKHPEVVRCKECKYYVNGQCWKSDGLDKLDGNVADDDFCSRGEREGE